MSGFQTPVKVKWVSHTSFQLCKSLVTEMQQKKTKKQSFHCETQIVEE